MCKLPRPFIEENLYRSFNKDGESIYAVLIPITRDNLMKLASLGCRVVFITSPEQTEFEDLFQAMDGVKWLKEGYISLPEKIERHRHFDGSYCEKTTSIEYPSRNGDFLGVALPFSREEYGFVSNDDMQRNWVKVVATTRLFEEFLEGLEDR